MSKVRPYYEIVTFRDCKNGVYSNREFEVMYNDENGSHYAIFTAESAAEFRVKMDIFGVKFGKLIISDSDHGDFGDRRVIFKSFEIG